MFSIFLLVIAFGLACYFFKLYFYEYWSRRGVPSPPTVLFFGNIMENLFMKKQIGEITVDLYKQFPNASMVGFYKMVMPSLLIRDPDLIKDIIIKSFSNFHDNDIDVDMDVDPLFGRNPFVLNGERWKSVRNQLTPCFTGTKMRSLVPILNSIGEDFVKFIERQPEAFNGKGYEAKELFTKLTINNVASCAFGLEGKCFEEENSDFRKLAHRFLTPGSWTSFVMLLVLIFPAVAKLFRIKLVPKDVDDELLGIVRQTLKYREENNIVRNDFLQFISSLRNVPSDYPFEDIDIAAHAASFFGDGYETSSIAMSLITYQIASNPEAQTKLREEIMGKLGDGQITYEKIQEMEYLDAVLNEGLRILPPVFFIVKRCTKSYTYVPKSNDMLKKNVTIEPGMSILIPTFAIQNDPKYYDEPRSFKPERFLGENKDKHPKYTFLPFGEGPRACLGKRFGVLQIKVGLIHLIKNYEISVNKKTKEPLTLNPGYFLTSPVGGIWLDFKKVN